jgi:hypothetical protein
MLRVIGTGPFGGPLSPLGRRTRVITGTNAAAVLSDPCCHHRHERRRRRVRRLLVAPQHDGDVRRGGDEEEHRVGDLDQHAVEVALGDDALLRGVQLAERGGVALDLGDGGRHLVEAAHRDDVRDLRLVGDRHLERGDAVARAQLDDVARLQVARAAVTREAAALAGAHERGAVGGAEIEEDDPPRVRDDARVLAGDVHVLEHDVVGRRAPDADKLAR